MTGANRRPPTSRSDIPQLSWYGKAFLSVSERIGLPLSVTLLSLIICVSSVATCWVIGFFWAMKTQNYVLSLIIPAVVAPPLVLSWVSLTQQLQHLIDMHEHLTRSAQADAEVDQLTGVYNRHGLFARAASVPAGSWVAVADLDDFKTINDTGGHAVGDHALVLVASELRRMATATGGPSLVARSGGDEFVLVMPECQDRPSSLSLSVPAAGTITVSLGWIQHTGELDRTLALADAAMYQAKHGRAELQTVMPEQKPLSGR